MNVFWLFLLLLLAVAIIILIVPLLRVKDAAYLAYKESNLAIYNSKLAELDQELEEGRIEQGEYKLARSELDRELLDDIPEESRETASEHYVPVKKQRPVLALVVGLFVPALSFLMYMQLGMHAASDSSLVKDHSQMSVGEMVLKLESHLKENDGTARDWLMLGRAYKVEKKYNKAVVAFEKSVTLEKTSQTLLELAEAMAFANNQIFTPEARNVVLEVLKMEPDNPNAIWFAGIAELQNANYWAALDHFTAIASASADKPDTIKLIRLYMEKAREELVAMGEKVDTVDAMLSMAGVSGEPAKATTQIHVSVDISAEAKKQFAVADTVFIYAKAMQGPPMPLAIKKLKASDLPATVTLDETMAMVEGMNLKTFPEVQIVARVSKTGSAMPQSGDYIGEQKGIATTVSEQDVKITISDRIP